MPILDVTEDFRGLGAGKEINELGRVVGNTSRRFSVLFDDTQSEVLLRPLMARDASAIPDPGEPHPYDVWLYAKSHTATVDEQSPLLYWVDVQYEQIEDPFSQPPEIEWDFDETNEPIDEDIDGNPLANYAKQPYDPPITEAFHDMVLRYRRNKSIFLADIADEYIGQVNSDYFLPGWPGVPAAGFPPGTVKCRVFTGVPAYAAGVNYWVVSYEFKIRHDGWRRRIKQEGLMVSVYDEGELTGVENAKDANGENVAEPIPLNEDGTARSATTDPPVLWVNHETKRKLPFAALNISYT